MTNPNETVEYMLGRMDQKLDQLLGVEARVTALEIWKAKQENAKARLAGYFAGASATGGAVVWILSHLLK